MKLLLFILISLEFKGLSIHATSKILTCPKTEFRLCLMKLCSSNNHYTTAQHIGRITRRFAEFFWLVEMLPLRLALCLLNKENAIIFHKKMTLNLRKFFYNKKREKKRLETNKEMFCHLTNRCPWGF